MGRTAEWRILERIIKRRRCSYLQREKLKKIAIEVKKNLGLIALNFEKYDTLYIMLNVQLQFLFLLFTIRRVVKINQRQQADRCRHLY